MREVKLEKNVKMDLVLPVSMGRMAVKGSGASQRILLSADMSREIDTYKNPQYCRRFDFRNCYVAIIFSRQSQLHYVLALKSVRADVEYAFPTCCDTENTRNGGPLPHYLSKERRSNHSKRIIENHTQPKWS